jgi:hypothetical protein
LGENSRFWQALYQPSLAKRCEGCRAVAVHNDSVWMGEGGPVAASYGSASQSKSHEQRPSEHAGETAAAR